MRIVAAKRKGKQKISHPIRGGGNTNKYDKNKRKGNWKNKPEDAENKPCPVPHMNYKFHLWKDCSLNPKSSNFRFNGQGNGGGRFGGRGNTAGHLSGGRGNGGHGRGRGYNGGRGNNSNKTNLRAIISPASWHKSQSIG
jgi:hypothetical protein